MPGEFLNWLTRLFFNTTKCPESYSIHVDPAGHVTFCSFYTNYGYGKYPETPVKDIWFSRKHAEFMQKINTGVLSRSVTSSVDRRYVTMWAIPSSLPETCFNV